MNKSFGEKLKDFFCCCRRGSGAAGGNFASEEFSLDGETTEITNHEGSEIENISDETQTEKESESKKRIVSPASVKTDETDHSQDMKKYAMEKLSLTDKEIEEQKRRKNVKELAKKDTDETKITKEELDEILSSVSESREKIAESKEEIQNIKIDKEKSDEKSKRVEKILADLKKNENESETSQKIKNISSDISTDTEEMGREKTEQSLRKKNITHISSSSSLSLKNFERTAPESSITEDSKDSEITCFIKYYDDKDYSKCLANKMKKHLKK